MNKVRKTEPLLRTDCRQDVPQDITEHHADQRIKPTHNCVLDSCEAFCLYLFQLWDKVMVRKGGGGGIGGGGGGGGEENLVEEDEETEGMKSS